MDYYRLLFTVLCRVETMHSTPAVREKSAGSLVARSSLCDFQKLMSIRGFLGMHGDAIFDNRLRLRSGLAPSASRAVQPVDYQ